MGYVHEMVHQQIFYKNGVSSHIVFFPSNKIYYGVNSRDGLAAIMATIPDNVCVNNCVEMYKEHTINDAIGYPLIIGVILISLVIVLGFYTIYSFMIYRGVNNGIKK